MSVFEDADQGGLIYAARLNGDGGGAALDWAGLADGSDRGSGLWVHLGREGVRAQQWLTDSHLDPFVVEALLADETRPRVVAHGDGVLVIIRGVNLNPHADPEDMISLRAWLEPGLLITVRKRPVLAIRDLRTLIASGHGPHDCQDLFIGIADRMIDRIGPVISEIDDSVAADEDAMLDGRVAGLRASLGSKRRQVIVLRRHIGPQRDVLTRMAADPDGALDAAHRLRLREVADQLTRYLEDMDAARERAAVMQEEMSVRASDETNRRMYILSIVAAIFLPLGLLTGLLGINVGGIPLAESPYGFAIVTGLLGVTAACGVALLKHNKLL